MIFSKDKIEKLCKNNIYKNMLYKQCLLTFKSHHSTLTAQDIVQMAPNEKYIDEEVVEQSMF